MPLQQLRETVSQILAGEQIPEFAEPDQAAAAFRSIATSLKFSAEQTDALASLLEKILASADPQMALNNIHRFVEASPQPDLVHTALTTSPETSTTLVTLMAGSQFLSDVLISQPQAFGWLFQTETLHAPRAPDYYRLGAESAVAGLSDRATQRAAISRWRRKEYLRIGCRDLLLLADAEDVSRDISDLAEAIIDQAALLVYDEISARFGAPVPEAASLQQRPQGSPTNMTPTGKTYLAGMCVLGMGKLGGRELNFSSDIDLVFIYEAEGETTGREDGGRRVAVISNHDFFTRMGEALIRFLGERGPEGNLFRVDMRLRPEGMDGPLVRSLESFVHYLSTQGRDWERLAYLKARVVSGPSRLAEKLYRMTGEFVFAGHDAGRIVREVQSLKLRIDREVINSDLYRRDVKRGYGGIREIEFVIASMQIIHGYHHHALRIRNTFLAVQRLLETHILSADEAQFYQHAYSFLRTIEHRLQMAQEAQTHTLPPPGPEFEAMARRCGFEDGALFMLEYTRVTDEVHERFTQFFQHDTEAVEQAARDVLIILDRQAPPEEAQAALERRGLYAPDALRLIHSLAYGTGDVFVTAEGQRSFEQMLPALLRLTAAAPFPEQVFSRLHSFALAIKSITYYYEVIAQHPDILKLLVTLFGTSDTLANQLIAQPEFFDSLISTRILNQTDKSGNARRERMNTALTVRTPARRLTMLRRAVNFERIVIALKYLLRIQHLDVCVAHLTATADIALDLAAQMAAARLLNRRQDSEKPDDAAARELAAAVERNLSILALGKYGGSELNFFGDLDVVFVYNGNGELPAAAAGYPGGVQEFYDAFADALTNVLTEQVKGGRAFVLDARLRPHGKNAPLSTELSAYEDYLTHQAETWELQAFHRARTAWGNPDLLERLTQSAKASAGSKSRKIISKEIREMRVRLEETVETSAEQIEVKRSPGGIVDIEFLIQFLVLSGQVPWVQKSGNYFHAIKKWGADALGAEDAAQLKACYAILRGVENTIRLITGGGESSLSTNSANARATAVAIGFGSVEELSQSIQETKAAVRAIYDRHLPDNEVA